MYSSDNDFLFLAFYNLILLRQMAERADLYLELYLVIPYDKLASTPLHYL
jgi:hypothetical protein